MTTRRSGRTNNESSKGPRRPNAAAALFAVAVSVLVISSDLYARRFWLDHPVTTATLAALVGILVSVTVIEVILDRRSERRWRLLAQYALLELAEAATPPGKYLSTSLWTKTSTTTIPPE